MRIAPNIMVGAPIRRASDSKAGTVDRVVLSPAGVAQLPLRWEATYTDGETLELDLPALLRVVYLPRRTLHRPVVYSGEARPSSLRSRGVQVHGDTNLVRPPAAQAALITNLGDAPMTALHARVEFVVGRRHHGHHRPSTPI